VIGAGRVLLVDDDPKVLRLLEATLRLKDYDVVKMESSAEALGWLRRNTPDLIISDIMMPGLDGYDFFRRVRASTRATQVPFIFLSARSEPEDVVRGLRLGADEFLRKPFSIDELLVRVERVLERGNAGADEVAAPGARGVFEGDLGHMALTDVLRMLSVQRKDGVLRVEPSDLRGAGAIRLVEGQATHAEVGILDGEIALFQLLMRDQGRFSFRPGENLPGESIAVQTLPLLMEAFRLIELGVLRKIDPHNGTAGLALKKVIEGRRGEVGPLPPIADLSEPSTPLGMPGLALRLTGGRPPVGGEEEGADFKDTIQFDRADLLGEVEEIPSLRQLLEQDDEITDLRSDGRGPDTWERAGLLGRTASTADATRGGDPDESIGLDSIEMAAAFVTSELEAIEDELGLREATHDEPAPKDDSGDPIDPGRIFVTSEVKAIALVDDTAYEAPLPKLDESARSDALMDIYEELKVVARAELKTREVQMGTRSGRVIASAIRDESRRGTVSAFSAQAIAFATEDASGTQFAVLNAGDLHVMVVEVDHLRLFTVLFDRQPEPESVLTALRPVLTRWRERAR
jgi:DNA-binding response OmpR family regulator